MNILRIISIPILLIFNHSALYAQYFDFDSLYHHDEAYKQFADNQPGFNDFFSSDTRIKLTIESDFKNLIKKKYKDEYQSAVLKYFISDTVVATRSIKIKPRGNMRKKSCYFPPLMLNFPKKDSTLNFIREFDKMKLVMDCKRGDTYEQYLLSEYYVYKLYNIITKYSFRVRLFDLTLIDSNDKMKSLTSYAFIIEDIELLAKRNEAISIDTKNIRDQLTNLPTLSNAYLLQYLIGNTDWSIPGLHNIKLIKSTDPTIQQPYVIPYDFDYAGIVNTNYAVPDERLGLESVRERVYRGVCIDESHIRTAAENFINSKQAIYELYSTSELLSPFNMKQSIRYLDKFYQVIESESGLSRNILNNCR